MIRINHGMLCRLCLNNLEENNGVSLFNNNCEWELTKMIARFLHLELKVGDSVSEIICNDCWMHLDDFQKFCKYVEDKQNTLLKEILKVKCVLDFDDTEVAPCVALTVNQSARNVIDNNEESLLDIKDVLITPSAEASPHVMQDVEFSYANDFADDMAEQDTSDDDVPLKILLKRKTEVKEKSKNLQKSTAAQQKTPIKTRVKKKLKIVKSNQTKTTENSANTKANLEKSNSKVPSKYSKDLRKSDEFISNSMELKCEICEKILMTFSQLKTHFRREHNCNGYVRCCDKRITKRIVLVDHIQYHLNPLHFQCLECNKVLASRNSYVNHMAVIHPAMDELKFQCEFCSQKYAKQYLLDVHLKKHLDKEKNHCCKICQKNFTTPKCLKMHIQWMHENVSTQICNYCGRKFRCRNTFKQHIAEHEGIVINPPVQCSICNDWLKNKYILRVHMKTHNPTHIECKECGRVCATQRILTEHTKKVHNSTHSYECTFCSKKFQKSSDLKDHMGTHTGERTNNCPHCASIFRAKSNMYRHIKKVHTKEWLASRNARSKALEEIAKKGEHNKVE